MLRPFATISLRQIIRLRSCVLEEVYHSRLRLASAEASPTQEHESSKCEHLMKRLLSTPSCALFGDAVRHIVRRKIAAVHQARALNYRHEPG